MSPVLQSLSTELADPVESAGRTVVAIHARRPKTHLAAIYEKLDASNRAEAVATGLRRGLIML